MADLVKRLRKNGYDMDAELEAADRIEALERELEETRDARADRLATILRRVCEAVHPFIKDEWSGELHDASDVSVDVKLCDIRALKAAVASIPPSLLSQADLDAIAEAKKELGE